MKAGFRGDIQGLRAIAVVAVVLDHAGLPFLGGGYVGVDVFFVISGFLISRQLLDRLATTGRIGFGEFYAARARRILPAALVVIALSVLGALVWMPLLLLPQTLLDALTAALYVPNYAQALQGTDYLTVAHPSLFQHYWSLGVEEQFYLLWPALLGVLWAASREGRRWMLPLVLGMVTVASLVACILVTMHHQPWAFFPLWTRAWELGAGGLLAVALARTDRRLPPRWGVALGWLGLGGIVVAATAFSSSTTFPGVAALLPVVGAVLVILGGSRAEPSPAGSDAGRFGAAALLERRPFQFLGRISYSLYLVHWPILILAAVAAGPYADLEVWQKVLLVAAAVPVAWALNRAVEEPGRRTPFLRRARPRRTLAAVGVTTAVVAGATVLCLAVVSLQPLDSGRAVAATAPTAPPATTAVVPSNLQPSLRTAENDNAALYRDGCQVGYTPSIPHPCTFGDPAGERIVLFGDSHAAQWFPALDRIAEGGDYRLETQTKSACPSIDVRLDWGGKPYVRCDRWRDAVIAQLRADPPALVVLANYSAPVFSDPTDTEGQWRRGLETTIRELEQFTRVAVIAGTPDLRHDPVVCLSAHLTSAGACGRPAAFALDSPGRGVEQSAAASAGADFIDLTPYFCTSDCPAIIGNTLVYRDSHHLTATFSAQLSGVLGARITPLLRP